MKLSKFIKKYVRPNSLVRLLYKTKAGHSTISTSWNEVQMGWAILEKEGLYKNYLEKKVEGVACILVTDSHYPEAINIVIEV